jgi:hypothetical protein
VGFGGRGRLESLIVLDCFVPIAEFPACLLKLNSGSLTHSDP